MTPAEVYALEAVIIAVFCLVSWLCYSQGKKDGYKDGQMDAIKGVIKYKLIEFKDGERKYYRDDELKDLIEQDYKIIKP